jgi:hypothetical protein
MQESFALPDDMAVALSQMLSKSSDCSAFVAMEMGDGYFFSAIVNGDLRWIETLGEIGKSEFMERSRVIPWGALTLSQQMMFGFAIAAWMKHLAQDHGLQSVITE